jgi:hypothetical protein
MMLMAASVLEEGRGTSVLGYQPYANRGKPGRMRIVVPNLNAHLLIDPCYYEILKAPYDA